MGKSKSAKADVTDYFMSLHFGIACGPVDALLGIYINEKTAWEGSVTEAYEIPINQPNLFGGNKKEGGAVGVAHFLPGHATQVMPEPLAGKLGRTSATCPAFRGVSTLFFHGGTSAFGSSGNNGFLWSSNNPIIAQTVWTKVQRAPVGLTQAKAMIGDDANPAHIIYEAMTNSDWSTGMGASGFDVDSFNAAGDTLFDEEFGLSIIWTDQSKVEDFVSEINDHIQGTVFINPRTGLWTLKLLRDDYDVATLRTITPDNAHMKHFQRKMWGEVANEIAVSWTNPANEKEETVTVQNLAAISAQGGIITDNRNYYGVRNEELARRLANRDLRSSSMPLATAEVELDRTAWDILPGEVVILNWDEDDITDITGIIMRVGSVDYGKVGDPTITVSLMEDVFSLERPASTAGASTAWTRPGEQPAVMANSEVLTLPAYFTASTDLQVSTISLDYPEVVAMVLAHQSGFDTTSFELFSEQVLANGSTSYATAGTKNTLDRITLTTALTATAQSNLPAASIANVYTGPRVGGFVFIGSGGDSAMEIAMVDSFDGTNWVLARGVLDTIPRAWPTGTPVWFVNSGTRIVDDQSLRAAGEVPDYKLLSRTSLGILPEASAPVINGTLTARPHLPLRPANVKVNTAAFGSVAIGSATSVAITWATRNRILEDGQVVRWAASSVAPEYAQETVVSIYDQTGTLVYEQGSLWVETSLSLPKTYFDRYTSITVLVRSRREGLWSLQNHSIQVTGLPGNGAASPPPAPPTATQPPATASAPGATAFAVTGTAISNASGASTPALIVSGTADNSSATGLVLRYRKSGVTVNYSYHPTVALVAGSATNVTISGLSALTDYIVEAAYAIGNQPLSSWRTLSPNPVTTGAFVSDNVISVGTRTAIQLLADVDKALADSAAALIVSPGIADAAASAAAAAASAASAAAAQAAAQAFADAAQLAKTAAEAAKVASQTAKDQAQAAYAAADTARGLAVDAKNLAASSATGAAGSATAAAGSASLAGTKATEAGNSATSASGFANTASVNATNAGNSASAAATSASGAAASNTAAGNSASAAQTAKVAAESARDNAYGSATAAASSASSAATSATAAGSSASSALTSATNAATSAGNASTSASQASTSATGAAGSASTASTSATNAANSANAAGSSATAAATSASVATTKADDAGTSALSAQTASTAAATSAGNASTSASQASTSATNASGSAATASTSATNAANSANAAGSSATAAATSASVATTKADDAGTSALSAQTAATNAATSAGSASTSATQASTSATGAAGSASTASTSATNAANSANAAGSSATAAATSASVATTKATDAGTSALSAQTSATNAATSAGTASTSATQASSSATGAAGSATTASTSATNAANSANAAGSSATAAATSASVATTKATEAGTSATSASTSANTASTQAGNAATSATAASSSAASASASAAAAQTTATLSATISETGLSKNPVFAAYTTSPGVPDGWSDWGGGSGTRTTGQAGSNGYRATVSAGGGSGIQQSLYLTKGYYVIEAEVWCESGNVSGAGIYVAGSGSNANLMMGLDTDLEGITGAGGAGVRRWAKLIYYSASENSTFYTLTGWSGLGSVTAKTLTWYRASIRPASQAEVNGNQAKTDVATVSATVTTQQTALADLSGKAYSRYMVEANANGVISGIYLVSSSGSAGVAVSAFKVKANVFAIVSPDLASTKIPFVYDAVAGKLVLNEVIARSANIEDLAVTTLKIGDSQITTDKLNSGAVSALNWSEQAMSVALTNSPATIFTLVRTSGAGSVGHILNINVTVQNTSSNAGISLTIYRNGVSVGGRSFFAQSSFTVTGAFSFFDQPGAGTNTYTINASTTPGSGSGASVTLVNMLVTELKR